MRTYIILLRGIMPTGKNKVPMAPLRAALEEQGLQDVRTYIQSGNVIASSDLGQGELEQVVHDVIARHFGGDVAVLARTVSLFRDILSRNPFKQADPKKLYMTLLAARPEERLAEAFLAIDYQPDQVQLIDDVVYILAAIQYNTLKANNNFIERKLRLAATTRVYKTVSKLVELTAS